MVPHVISWQDPQDRYIPINNQSYISIDRKNLHNFSQILTNEHKSLTYPYEKTRQKKKKQFEEHKFNPLSLLILILICVQGQRPSYLPEATKAQRCWSVLALKPVITLRGSDLGK